MRGPRLNVERRQVLQLLASSADGVNEELLVFDHGFTRRMLTGLVRTGLAAVEREVIKAGGKTIEVVKVRITAAGRNALAAERS
jgi:hypothetical protein